MSTASINKSLVTWIMAFILMACTSKNICNASDVTVEEVSFPSHNGADSFQLEGFLYLPSATTTTSDRVPGLVLMHGDGPHSRDKVVTGQLDALFPTPISVFADIGAALAAEGIAVLTYDKRSCGNFNGCSDNEYPSPSEDAIVDDFLSDGMAAVKYLREGRSEVDPEKIVVAGHSQAGSFVPILLEAMPEIASGIMLAGPYRPIDEVLADQLEYYFEFVEECVGIGPDQILELFPSVAEMKDLVDGVQGIRDTISAGNQVSPDLIVGGSSAMFWLSWFNMTDRALEAAATMDQTMMVLQGEVDSNVNVEEFELWADYLASVNASFELSLLPCITHVLNCIVDRGNGIVGNTVDEQVTQAMVEFIELTTTADATTTLSPSSSPPTTYSPTTATTADMPSLSPTTMPSSTTGMPSPSPTVMPSSATSMPSPSPTVMPSSTTVMPSPSPTVMPSSATVMPSPSPTVMPSSATVMPSPSPTIMPSSATGMPSPSPTAMPSSATGMPSPSPTIVPSNTPGMPSPSPTITPSSITGMPSLSPTAMPSSTTGIPSLSPTATPSSTPDMSSPSPTVMPSGTSGNTTTLPPSSSPPTSYTPTTATTGGNASLSPAAMPSSMGGGSESLSQTFSPSSTGGGIESLSPTDISSSTRSGDIESRSPTLISSSTGDDGDDDDEEDSDDTDSGASNPRVMLYGTSLWSLSSILLSSLMLFLVIV